MSRAKQYSLLLLSATGIFTLILAVSLPNLVLSPGQSFSLGPPRAGAFGISGVLSGGDLVIAILRGLVALALISLPVYIVYSLLTSEGRRRLIAVVILIAGLLLIANYLKDHRPRESAQQETQVIGAPPNSAEGSSDPTAIFPAAPPSWLPPLVILAASTIAVFLVFTAIAFFSRRAKTPEFPLEQLGREAQHAIAALHSGGDLKVAIIRCYEEMSRVVKEERGLIRDIAMTPREFQDRLISKGLPQESIATLTKLFEQVRYSSTPTDSLDESKALSCLTDIVNACKARGNNHEV